VETEQGIHFSAVELTALIDQVIEIAKKRA
jgi:hypothetical protein